MTAAKELNVWQRAMDFLSSGVGPDEYKIQMETSNGTFRYSMPAHVAKTARKMGLEAVIHIDRKGSTFIPTILQLIYPQAIRDAQELDIRVNHFAARLSQNERQLKVLYVLHSRSLHYVLRRPDRSYMNPNDGMNYDTYTSLQGTSRFFKYKDTGISVVVRPA